MTLALLLTAVTGAWAQGASFDTKLLVPPSDWATDNGYLTADNMPSDFKPISETEALTWTGAPATGYAYLFYAFDGNKSYYIGYNNGSPWSDNTKWTRNYVYSGITTNSEFVVYYPAASASEVTVSPVTGQTNQWTFEMPGSDVMLTPVYAPVAQWAKVENVDQIPTAIVGIFAGEAKAIVNEGTVAKAGSTENAQGTVMYLTTTDANMTKEQARDAVTGWTSTVPTGAVLTGGFNTDQTVYVWYYIAGANTPDGQTPTAENTFNDSEICATPLTVTLKANQFNLTFSPAPVSNATVTVGGTAATAEQLNTGKIEKVGTGTEIKLKAATGYKFKKVEVKKDGGKVAAEATTEDVGKLIGADGNIYADKAAATAASTTAVAMIAYVGNASDCSHGLAIALTDESGAHSWSNAGSVCSGKTAVTGGTWRLPSIKDWQYMFIGCGSNDSYNDNPHNVEYSKTELAAKLSTVEGTALSTDHWTSTESTASSLAWKVSFGSTATFNKYVSENNPLSVRACLAF